MKDNCPLYIKRRLECVRMFGQSVHPACQPASVAACPSSASDDEDLVHLEEQQHMASELARLLVLHEPGSEGAPLSHAEIHAWLQKLLARGVGVDET